MIIMKELEHYYNREQVQALLGCGIVFAQQRMKMINDKLAKQGYLIRRGYVPKKIFNEMHQI